MSDWVAMVGDCRELPLPDESVEAVVTDPPYGLSFMGREWDHDVPGPEYWTEVKRVMKPGAHLLAFGGTRTFHWLTVAIEEAGFEVRDCLSWNYGTGFPKSHRFSAKMNGNGSEWDGWGTALKPAWEPIVLAMKPTDGTFAENALEHGVAGLNIDGCRIGTETISKHGYPGEDQYGALKGKGAMDADPEYSSSEGRWPANVTLSHTRWCRRVGTKRVERRHIEPGKQGGFGDVGVSAGSEAKGTTEEEVEDWDCPPSCPVRQLDEQSGELHYQDPATRLSSSDEGMWGTGERVAYDDRGGASRFYYCAKASRSEREAGLPDVEGRANQHPTVKPIDLCKWLVRLVTRKEHTVLDPFMGSGSIGCAAVQERRNYIGIDLEKEYVDIANKRIGHWQPNQRDMFKDMGGPNE